MVLNRTIGLLFGLIALSTISMPYYTTAWHNSAVVRGIWDFDIEISDEEQWVDPFNITSNEDFINQGWPGSGTADDPFIISGLYIRSDSLCVGIFNTTSHFVIGNCKFYGRWGMVIFGTGVLLANVTNGVLENNRFFVGEYGILLDNVTHCRISKNWMENCITGIELESTHSSALLDNTILEFGIGLMSRRCSDCTVANNIFPSGRWDPSTRIWLDDPDSCVLENNTIDGGESGIWIQGNNSRITENIISNCDIGIKIEEINSRVTENTISSCRTGISLGGSWNCILDFNRVHSNYIGIELSDSADCVIVDNLIYDNTYCGFYLNGSRNCTLDFNRVHLNDYGIELWESADCVIVDNLIYNNTYCGIYLYGSRNCTLDFNRVHHNDYGIRLWNSNDCLIVDNLVYNNTGVGVFLSSSCMHNRIYGNQIGGNAQNARCDGANNSWDDGVNRGNIWSNYNGTYLYFIPGEGQCIDQYPSPWFPCTYEGPVIFLLGGVLFLIPLGVVLGSRRHVAFDIIQRTSYRLVFGFRKKKNDQDDIVVPVRYRLVSRFRNRRSIKHANVDKS